MAGRSSVAEAVKVRLRRVPGYSFARGVWGDRRRVSVPLLIEAGFALAAARLLTTIPFRVAVRRLGLRQQPRASSTNTDSAHILIHPEAAAVGAAIARVAPLVPFRAVCLQRALAAALMLRRRRLPVALHFSVARDGAKTLAHARALSDDTVVTGGDGGRGFEPIAVFSAPRADRPSN